MADQLVNGAGAGGPQLRRMNTAQVVDVSSGFLTAMLCAGSLSHVISIIPLGFGMYVAISNWNEKCDQYLQLWLVLNGVIQLILLVPAVISTCEAQKAAQDKELIAYVYRKKQAEEEGRAFEQNVDIEERLASKQTPGWASKIMKYSQWPTFIWLAIGILWESQSTDRTCLHLIRQWTNGIIIFQLAFPCFACCCMLCFGVGGLVGNLDMEQAQPLNAPL
ncbi:unnamed protein product [Durusdinium trenchii]|uniref:Uncharacterized protein n=1 Tax=Durusdinium trenchii TaxID=1381693 RepID=A0ABP0JZW4_9DINO